MAAGLCDVARKFSSPVFMSNWQKTRQVAEGLKAAAAKHGISLAVNYVGAMFGFFRIAEPEITRFEQVSSCDIDAFKRFYHLMLQEGVYLAPSCL